jgi:F0F1-type ATP synthase gamma subunit
MNFHALVHIDSARRQTEKFIRMESEVSKILDIIVNNRNFLLDKQALQVDEDSPPLNIFIGSDLSFCGPLNATVAGEVNKDRESQKIIIGKKLKAAANAASDVVLSMSREEYDADTAQIDRILEDSILSLRHSSINIVYNHFYHAGRIALRKRKIFPIPLASSEGSKEDFVVEGDTQKLLRSLTSTYAGYEVRIAAINSFAAENVLRQDATTESLKKIDEMEVEEVKVKRKAKKAKAFTKVLDSFVKQKVFGRNG